MKIHSAESLHSLASGILSAHKTPEDECRIVADHLVECNLLGLDSHGVIRIPEYVERIGRGVLVPGTPITFTKERGATAVFDCAKNFGQVGATVATEWAIDRAKEFGISSVVGQRCNHVGRLGAYPEKVARQGMISLAFCNAWKAGHWVAPFGGSQGRFSPNPLAFAAPTGGDPVLFDASTSATSEGKVRVYQKQGKTLPEPWIADATGRPSCDPNDLYGPPRGTILPTGTVVSGYKGMGLALMVELLSGTLAGETIGAESCEYVNGFSLIVIDTDHFLAESTFRALADEMTSYVKSSPLAGESEGIFMPGEINFDIKRKRSQEGIEIDDATWEELCGIATRAGVDVPG